MHKVHADCHSHSILKAADSHPSLDKEIVRIRLDTDPRDYFSVRISVVIQHNPNSCNFQDDIYLQYATNFEAYHPVCTKSGNVIDSHLKSVAVSIIRVVSLPICMFVTFSFMVICISKVHLLTEKKTFCCIFYN